MVGPMGRAKRNQRPAHGVRSTGANARLCGSVSSELCVAMRSITWFGFSLAGGDQLSFGVYGRRALQRRPLRFETNTPTALCPCPRRFEGSVVADAISFELDAPQPSDEVVPQQVAFAAGDAAKGEAPPGEGRVANASGQFVPFGIPHNDHFVRAGPWRPLARLQAMGP